MADDRQAPPGSGSGFHYTVVESRVWGTIPSMVEQFILKIVAIVIAAYFKMPEAIVPSRMTGGRSI